MNATRKQARCLQALLDLVAQGVEYPEAEWKASQQGTAIDCSTLRDLYDAFVAECDAHDADRLDDAPGYQDFAPQYR
jgi:hypothetical protein